LLTRLSDPQVNLPRKAKVPVNSGRNVVRETEEENPEVRALGSSVTVGGIISLTGHLL
jgi:hypothetical protein